MRLSTQGHRWTEVSTQRKVVWTLLGALEAFKASGQNIDTPLCSLSRGCSNLHAPSPASSRGSETAPGFKCTQSFCLHHGSLRTSGFWGNRGGEKTGWVCMCPKALSVLTSSWTFPASVRRVSKGPQKPDSSPGVLLMTMGILHPELLKGLPNS